MSQTAKRLLTTREAADRLRLSSATLEKDRISGKLNIPFLKIGKAVRYDPDHLDQYIETCRRRSTSDPGPAPVAPASS